MEFLPPSTNFLLLRLYMVSSEFFYTTAIVMSKIMRGVQAAFSERNYLFLENYSTPFPEESVNAYASSSAAVEFFYCADKHQFSKGVGNNKRLPILSLEILRDGVVLFDLTDFIEKVSVISTAAFPSVSQIVQAWMIDSHVILDRGCDFVARIISNSGTSYEFDVRDDLDLGDAILIADNETEQEAGAEDGVTAEDKAAAEEKTAAEDEAAAEPLKIE